jgi:GNAT superfamily N-acetyltransferase
MMTPERPAAWQCEGLKSDGEFPIAVRPATADDYATFVRLCPMLGTGDPIPAPEVWASAMVPTTWVAAIQDEMVAYCYVQQYVDTGYVRSIVVDPTVRRRGVGRLLMITAAEQLRAQGKTFWRLNVKPDNVAALALYTSLGLQAKYSATAFRLPWTVLDAVPSFGAVVRLLTADRERMLEDRFSLPHGQLSDSRRIGRTLFEAVAADGQSILGLSVFNPSFPGAFPFRVVDPPVAGDLLAAMRVLVPADEAVNLVAEDDEPLAALLLQVGAALRMKIVHMIGAL